MKISFFSSFKLITAAPLQYPVGHPDPPPGPAGKDHVLPLGGGAIEAVPVTFTLSHFRMIFLVLDFFLLASL